MSASPLSLVPRKAPALQLVRHASVLSSIPSKGPAAAYSTDSTVVLPPTRPYAELTVGVPQEVYPNERRVAITPQNVALLLKKGFLEGPRRARRGRRGRALGR